VPERLDIAHDLPDDLAAAFGDDLQAAGTLYNDLQELSDEAFAARFGDAHEQFRAALDLDADFVTATLGLALSDGRPLVADATLLSVHEPRGDGGVETLHYTGPAGAGTDTVLMLPVRPGDCPPGSNRAASDLSLAGFREVVSAMAYKRFDLLENDLDGYRDSYLRPAVRGLEAYAAATR
jgi:hypothetical protein